jgi:arylformamidase
MSVFIDLTRILEEGMPVYPGDPKFKREIRKANESKGTTSYQVFQLASHHGTHVDFPAHIYERGNNSSIYYGSIPDFTMPGTICDVRKIGQEIGAGVKKFKGIKGAILFYTGFTEEEKVIPKNFPYFTAQSIEDVLKNNPKLRMLGIDSFSVDKKGSLEVHKALLKRGILIVEGLTNLSRLYSTINEIKKEEFTFHCVPLKIAQADAVPVSAYAEI